MDPHDLLHDFPEYKNYQGPWLLTSREWNTMRCLKLQDGRFHVYKRGITSSLIEGYEFILASRPLATLIKETCQSLVEVQPVVVMNIATGEEWPDYFELDPLQWIRYPELPDASGYQVWHFRRSTLFVSPVLKDEITRSGIADLEFGPGWFGWLGI